MTSTRSDFTVAKRALVCSATIRSMGIEGVRALISCSKTKGNHRDLARDMYASPLYRKSLLLVERWGLPFSILSAKYGLLDPSQTIEPYDYTLKGASKVIKLEWAKRVDTEIRNLNENRFVMLAGDDYVAPLIEVGGHAPLDYFLPMRGLSLGARLTFLNEGISIERRRAAVREAYGIFEKLAKRTGLHSLRDTLDGELPSHGVYFFFDESESTVFSRTIPRLVRIGTHGVSKGSVATLRNRLRTHLGTRAGLGNHRASVFRLHVGRAIIEREGLQEDFPHWGKGQSAGRQITDPEAPMERRVSEYIGNLRVLFIPVLDSAGTGSMRATLERQFIAMFTESLCPIETNSPSWLGRYSDKLSIKETGLWNVRDVGEKYDVKFLSLLRSFIERPSLI